MCIRSLAKLGGRQERGKRSAEVSPPEEAKVWNTIAKQSSLTEHAVPIRCAGGRGGEGEGERKRGALAAGATG